VLKARLKIGLLSRMIGRIVINEQVWECLRRKLTGGSWNDECVLIFLTALLDSYFIYEASASRTFAGVDTCQIHSGTVSPFANSSAARSPSAWSSSSTNSMPLTERHHISQATDAVRIAEAQTKLTFLVEHRSNPPFKASTRPSARRSRCTRGASRATSCTSWTAWC